MADPQAKEPSIIAVIKMYRSERGLSFMEAKALAILEFEKRGWSTDLLKVK